MNYNFFFNSIVLFKYLFIYCLSSCSCELSFPFLLLFFKSVLFYLCICLFTVYRFVPVNHHFYLYFFISIVLFTYLFINCVSACSYELSFWSHLFIIDSFIHLWSKVVLCITILIYVYCSG